MSRNAFSHLYVQRWGGTFVVRQRSGREPLPGPSDPIVQRFDEREDAHEYVRIMAQASLDMHRKSAYTAKDN